MLGYSGLKLDSLPWSGGLSDQSVGHVHYDTIMEWTLCRVKETESELQSGDSRFFGWQAQLEFLHSLRAILFHRFTFIGITSVLVGAFVCLAFWLGRFFLLYVVWLVDWFPDL